MQDHNNCPWQDHNNCPCASIIDRIGKIFQDEKIQVKHVLCILSHLCASVLVDNFPEEERFAANATFQMEMQIRMAKMEEDEKSSCLN